MSLYEFSICGLYVRLVQNNVNKDKVQFEGEPQKYFNLLRTFSEWKDFNGKGLHRI